MTAPTGRFLATVVPGRAGPAGLELVAYFEADEIPDQMAPPVNAGRLYFRDNGAGKTQLVVRFPTGAIQILATEP